MPEQETSFLQGAPTPPLTVPSQIVSPTFVFEPAGFFIRLAAFLIDGYIVSLIIGFVNFLLFSTFILISGNAISMLSGQPPNNSSNPLFFIGSFLVFFLTIILVDLMIVFGYFVLMTAKYGTTPGKELFKIKIVDQNGNIPPFKRLILRESVGRSINTVTLGIGYFLVAFDKKKQGLHDKIADTFAVLSQPVEGIRKTAASIIVSAQILMIVGFIFFYIIMIATTITGFTSLVKTSQESKQKQILKDGQIENLLQTTPEPNLPSYLQFTPNPTPKEATQQAQPKYHNPFQPLP